MHSFAQISKPLAKMLHSYRLTHQESDRREKHNVHLQPEILQPCNPKPLDLTSRSLGMAESMPTVAPMSDVITQNLIVSILFHRIIPYPKLGPELWFPLSLPFLQLLLQNSKYSPEPGLSSQRAQSVQQLGGTYVSC